MSTRLAALAFGAAFGAVIAWSQASDPRVIRDMLLLEDARLFLMMGSAVVVAWIGLRLLRRARVRALATGRPIDWTTTPPARRHVSGAVLFGAGWSIALACPGPIAVQLGAGAAWGIATAAGMVAGLVLFRRREQRAARPATADGRARGLTPADGRSAA